MKRNLILVMSMLIAMVASAQDSSKSQTPEERAERLTRQMEKRLSLTPEQIPQVKAIHLEAAKKKEELKADTTKGPDKKVKMEAIEKTRDEKLKAVLTSEQYNKYIEGKEKMKERRKEKGKKKKEKSE